MKRRARIKTGSGLVLLLAFIFMLCACSADQVASSDAAASSSADAAAASSEASQSDEAQVDAAASEDVESSTEQTGETTAPDSEAASDTSDPEQIQEAGARDLVVYYSWSGNTRSVAQAIAAQTGADVFEIVPTTPYPDSYDETVDLAQEEKRDGARPAFEGEISNFDSYERVFVGYPNWWGDMPMILYTFFDTYDFAGKTLAPFVTSYSSGFSGTISTIETLEPDAQVTSGLDIFESNLDGAEQAVADWLAEIQN